MPALLFFYQSSIAETTIKPEKNLAKSVGVYLKGINAIAADFTQLLSSGEVYSGKFFLLKENRSTKVSISYTEGLNQKIFINGSSVKIKEGKNNRVYTYSISQTPIYSIITGSLDLKNENFEILENSAEWFRIRLIKSSVFGGCKVSLAFSKYEKTGNIKNLAAWIIDDGRTETLFSFNEGTMFVNDKKKVKIVEDF